MADSLVQYNSVAAACRTATPCLWQVAGRANNDPADQLSACQSLFGIPQVATVTVAANAVFSTATATSTYTDIIVDTSTVYSTVEEISTSYETAYVTATEYTTTAAQTLTVTVPANVGKRGMKRRRGCRPSTSIISSTLASAVPSQSSSSPSSSATPSPPVASSCADLAEHSSACACLEPATVTSYYDAVTSIIYSTKPVTVTSTSNTVVTVAVTTVIVKPATTTLTSTLSTQTDSTTTVTVTAAPAAPTIFTVRLADGVNVGRPVLNYGTNPYQKLVWAPSGTPRALTLSEGALSLMNPPNYPIYKMYIRLNAATYGMVYMITDETATTPSGDTWLPATCSVDPYTLILSCSTTTGLHRFLTCGTSIYLAGTAIKDWPAGCPEVHLRATQA